MRKKIKVSSLGKTWLLDLDGTLLKHNGYLVDGKDTFLSGAKDFLNSIPLSDMIIFLTSRTEKEKELTLNFLNDNQIRYNHIIFNLPYGERIIINDTKPSGLKTALAICTKRDKFSRISYDIDRDI